MWRGIIFIVAFAAVSFASQTIAADSTGLVVEVSQKYGARITEECTVVSLEGGNFVLTKRSGKSSWYPTAWHSIRILDKSKESIK